MSRSRRRIVALLLAVCGTVSLAACGETRTPVTPRTDATTSTPEGDFDPSTHDWSGAGAPSGTSFRSLSDDVVLTRAGQVLADVSTDRGGASVSVRDAVAGVRDCELGTALNARTSRGEAQVTVDNCTIDSDDGSAVGGASVVVRDSRLTSLFDGVNPTGGAHNPPSVIEGNVIERDGSPTEQAHNDGVQLWQGGHVTIARNHITGWATSAVMIKSDLEQEPGDGPITDVVVTQNYLANPTGYYVLYVADGGKGLPEYVDVTDNVFGPHRGRTVVFPVDGQVFVRTRAERAAAVAAGVDGAATWVVWSGNVDATNGREITPPGGWRSYP